MSKKLDLKGSCLCGAVNISMQVKDNGVGVCHCGMCRRWTGGPLFAIECDQGLTLDGETNVSVYASSEWAERGFCKQCGTHLFYRLKDGSLYAVPPGLLESTDALVFDQQIFIDEKPAYYEFANKTRMLTGAEVFARFAGPDD